MPIRKVTVLPTAAKAALLREEIRNALPLPRYIAMLHDAVVAGRIQDTDRDGNPTGTSTEVPIKDRLAIAQYLINKVLPDKAEPVLNITKDDVLRMSPEQLRGLPVDQLVQALALATSPTIESETPCSPPGSSTSASSPEDSSSSPSDSSP